MKNALKALLALPLLLLLSTACSSPEGSYIPPAEQAEIEAENERWELQDRHAAEREALAIKQESRDEE